MKSGFFLFVLVVLFFVSAECKPRRPRGVGTREDITVEVTTDGTKEDITVEKTLELTTEGTKEDITVEKTAEDKTNEALVYSPYRR